MTTTSFSRLAAQLGTYGAVGVLATAVHYAIMASLISIQWMPVSASTAGAAAGALVAYMANRLWTFKASHSARRMVRFMAVAALGLLLNAVFLYIIHQWLTDSVIFAQLATTALVFVATFAINLKWSFA